MGDIEVTTEALTAASLEHVDALELSPQAKRLRDAYFEVPVRVAVERPLIAMESWKKSDGQPIQLRRARLLKDVLEQIPVAIHEGELTAGSETKYFRGVFPTVDHDPELLLHQIDGGKFNLQSSVHLAGDLSREDWEAVVETARYFSGKTGMDYVRELRSQVMGSWWDDFMEVKGNTPFEATFLLPGVVLFEKVLEVGLNGIIKQADEGLARFARLEEDDPEKLLFWQSVVMTCQAAIRYAERYAELAHRMAAAESDPARSAQLQRIATFCRHVPANPARNFHEALQSVRLTHLACKLEGTFSSSMGRMDQYLYPYYAADIASGRLTGQETIDLIADQFSYCARQDIIFSYECAENVQSSSAVMNINVGGETREGSDACNELTYLFLHVTGLMRYAQPGVTFRLSPVNAQYMVLKALRTNYIIGGGLPQFQGDPHIIKYLTDRGATLEDARDWCTSGCSQPVSPKNRAYLKVMWPNVPLALDLALNDGVASKTGKRIGPATGDARSFDTFEKLYQAFTIQLENNLKRAAWQCRFGVHALAQRQRLPFASSILPGCVENGKDAMLGGQWDHSLWYMKDRGIVNAADSLTAIKKLVYEDETLTMDRLLAALRNDFEGPEGEEVRRLCLGAPKYGNEIAEADAMVRDVAKFSAGVIFRLKNPFGQNCAINRNGVAWHHYGGQGVGALPDGRKSGEALSNGSLSAMQGMDRSGPTAMLNSAIAADFKESASSILNLRFPKSLMSSAESLEKLAALTKTFIFAGGSHVQYNMLDHRILLDAQKHPEKYKDLVVRIAGYSAYFIHLTPEVQNDLIRRTEQML